MNGDPILAIRALPERVLADDGAIELVTSGPDVAGMTRDTGVVLRELFTRVEQRVPGCRVCGPSGPGNLRRPSRSYVPAS